jgi:hypothetical protein
MEVLRRRRNKVVVVQMSWCRKVNRVEYLQMEEGLVKVVVNRVVVGTPEAWNQGRVQL